MILTVRVKSPEGSLLPCKIVLERPYGKGSCAGLLADTVYCGGTHAFELTEGIYDLKVTRGKRYVPRGRRVEMKNEDISLEIELPPLWDIKALGVYAFDAHSHVSRDETIAAGNLKNAAAVMMAEDFQFFFAGSPYDHDTHLEYLEDSFDLTRTYRERFSAELEMLRGADFYIDIGNEIVKCRYGHVFMMNYVQKPPFSLYYDHAFDPWLFTKEGGEPPYEISYIHQAVAKERGAGSVAVSAHPTSWWWHSNGEFITNIAATIGFELLAGTIDAMVIMGYQREQPSYEALWLDALNNGYFLPGVAETDAAFDKISHRHLDYKTYAYADEMSADALCGAIKKGRCVATSGPFLNMRLNGRLPGTVLKRDLQSEYMLDIEAIGCCEGMISTVQVILNGEIYREYKLCQSHVKLSLSLTFEEDGYVLVKCRDFAGNAAIANPVYVRNASFKNDNFLSEVTAEVCRSGTPTKGRYRIDDGESVPFSGTIKTRMPAAALLYIESGGMEKAISLFELEELQSIFKNLYFGRFNKELKYRPGEVPAEMFRLKEIRDLLSDARLKVDFD